MADEQFLQDYFRNYTQGLGGGQTPAGWGPQTTPDIAADTTGMTDAAPASTAPPQAAGGGLGQMFSFLGGGGAAAPAASTAAPTAPGWQQGAIGLGLGLLAGNPFNKWGAAMQGYQRGAAADVTRAQQAEAAQYHQQELALRKQQMAQQERLAQLTGDIKDYQYYKQQGGTLPFMEYRQEIANLQNKQYGTVQQMWVPKDPNDLSKGYDLKFYQPTSRGGFAEAAGLPPGATPAQINKPVQTPEGIVMMPQRVPPPAPTGAGAPAAGAGTTPGPTQGATLPGTGLAARASATEEGKILGKSKMTLGELEKNTDTALGLIDQLKNHKSLPNIVGYGNLIPEAVLRRSPGGAAEALSMIDQLKALNFGAGVEVLRGMGALSNREGAQVTNALGRIEQRGQSVTQYQKALDDIATILERGRNNARRKVRGEMLPAQPPSDEGGGATVGGAGGGGGGGGGRTYDPATGTFR